MTVFSAPDYCGEFDNKASVVIVDQNLKCNFKFLQPLKRLNCGSTQMQQLFKECARFEDLLPFKKMQIETFREVLAGQEDDFVTLKHLQ